MAKQPSEYEKKLIEMQFGMRENNYYMQDCFNDLENWSKDMKEKEKQILENPESIKKSKGLPPIRSLNVTKKKKKIKKASSNESDDKQVKQNSSKKPRDYRAWDKLDVDKMCQEVDEKKSSSSEYTTDEEWEEEQRKVKANWEKERGNQFFKDNLLNEAINCYTTAIELEPTNYVYPGNRAMCLIKQEKYAAAELDCTLSINLNDKYAKAYHRRATCRTFLKKYEEAKQDYLELLKLEPNSKLAQLELNKIEQLIDTRQLVFPVVKKENEKSTKPLKRILIEEINGNPLEKAEMEKTQALLNQRIELNNKEEKLFEINQAKVEEICEKNIEKFEQIKLETKPTITTEKPSINESKTLTIPEAPMNGYQFKKDWQHLSKNIQSLASYFKKISPKQYTNLFMNGLESDYLSKILVIFKDYYLKENAADLMFHLKCLSQVKRFNTQLMFLSKEDKKNIDAIFSYLKDTCGVQGNNLEELIKCYTD